MPDIVKETIAFFFILWFFWALSGGAQRIEEAKKPFIKPIDPLNTGEVYGVAPIIGSPSLDFKKTIKVGEGLDYSNAKLSASVDKDTGRRLIEIQATPDSQKPLNITGWYIKGIMDRDARVIGQGAQLFYQGQVNQEKDIILYPGEKAYIIAGESPVGASFKLNKCSGYLQQFQIFEPSLPVGCPHPGLDRTIAVTDQFCSQFMRSILRCNAFVGEFPSNITRACKNLIDDNLTHNSCVNNHLQDKDFYKGEWRVYLGGKDFFGSKNGDVLTIYDKEGKKIDSIVFD
jgi:hypothetical protein